MGRAARAKQAPKTEGDGYVVLERGDFFELKSAYDDAFSAFMVAQERNEAARKARADAEVLSAKLAKQYGFDPKGQYRFDKEALSLVPMGDAPQTPERLKD